jgi:PAS domain S-box-containing protein
MVHAGKAAGAVSSEARFHELILDLRVGVLVQGPSAEIRVSNPAALDLLGLDEGQLLGKTSLDPDWNATHEDGSLFPGSEHPVPTAIRTKSAVRGVVMGVYRPRRKDRVWLLVDAEPHLDGDGDVSEVVCTFSDITDRKRLEAQVAAGDRLASMGRLAAGVAHEINNPLSYVIGHLEALRQTGLDATQRKAVEEVLEGVGRVRTIVDDLRNLSRGQDERRGPVDLLHVVITACNIVAPQLKHRAILVRDLVPVPMVDGNESRLGQLVLNLLMNAAEAVREGHATENEVRVRVHPDDEGRIVLEVIDTGEGIPPSVRERIFDPFFTTKPVGVGTGLGLAICRGIVTSHGGEIEVESSPGKGSTFRVRLRPSAEQRRAGELAAPAPAAAEPAPEASRVRARVLVIDDEPRVGDLLVRLLSPAFDASLEPRAASALERIKAGEHFDAILCDLMMPDMTGMDLQEALERDLPALAGRTVFMTGGAFTPRAQAFVERYPTRLLQKPFRMSDVHDAVARIVAIPETE